MRKRPQRFPFLQPAAQRMLIFLTAVSTIVPGSASRKSLTFILQEKEAWQIYFSAGWGYEWTLVSGPCWPEFHHHLQGRRNLVDRVGRNQWLHKMFSRFSLSVFLTMYKWMCLSYFFFPSFSPFPSYPFSLPSFLPSKMPSLTPHSDLEPSSLFPQHSVLIFIIWASAQLYHNCWYVCLSFLFTTLLPSTSNPYTH